MQLRQYILICFWYKISNICLCVFVIHLTRYVKNVPRRSHKMIQKQYNKLNPSTFFIEVPAPCQKSERSCTVLYMCIRGINFAYVSLIFLSYFRTVRTVWYILFFLFCYIKHLCFFNPTVKVLAKHTAWQHTYDNFYSTKWVTYGGNLVGGDTPLYKHITKKVEEANITASQRERCESFILKWVKEHAKPETNKVSFQ